MNYHVYYVTWWIRDFSGMQKLSGPHMWFYVPMHHANAMDAQITSTMVDPSSPYRDESYFKPFYTVHSIEVARLPPPAQPDPDDPTMEELP